MKRIEEELKKTKLNRDDLLAQLQSLHRETAEMRNENAELKVKNSHFEISQDEALKKERVALSKKRGELAQQFEAQVQGLEAKGKKDADRLRAQHKEALDKIIAEKTKLIFEKEKEMKVFY